MVVLYMAPDEQKENRPPGRDLWLDFSPAAKMRNGRAAACAARRGRDRFRA
jgi:hypothetical protein